MKGSVMSKKRELLKQLMDGLDEEEAGQLLGDAAEEVEETTLELRRKEVGLLQVLPARQLWGALLGFLSWLWCAGGVIVAYYVQPWDATGMKLIVLIMTGAAVLCTAMGAWFVPKKPDEDDEDLNLLLKNKELLEEQNKKLHDALAAAAREISQLRTKLGQKEAQAVIGTRGEKEGG